MHLPSYLIIYGIKLSILETIVFCDQNSVLVVSPPCVCPWVFQVWQVRVVPLLGFFLGRPRASPREWYWHTVVQVFLVPVVCQGVVVPARGGQS